jgi:hypothetical protein
MVEANARLTGGLAAMLLVLLAIEGVTVVRVGQLLTLHVVVGLILIPPILLKIASTTWRFARYYGGHPAYREKGPPRPALRVLGPFVIGLTVLLFASGVALIVSPDALGGRLLLIHRASFLLWFAVTAIHVLGHLRETAHLAPRDWAHRTRRQAPGAGGRQLLMVLSLAVGALLAFALVGRVTVFRDDFQHHKLGPPPPAAATGARPGRGPAPTQHAR